MKVLQDRCVAQEGVICWYRKHQEIENKERDQYKEAFCTLNEELTSVNAKLKEKSRLLEEAENVRATLATELSTFHEQMDKAKADVVTEFRAS